MLARGAWGEARARFSEALGEIESPDAYEGLGIARYELDGEIAIEAHELGYRLARAERDGATAAPLAIQLAYDGYAFRGKAEASRWVERAALLVDGEPPSVAAACVPMLRAHLALLSDHDPESARVESERAIALAREVGAVDVEDVRAGAERSVARQRRGNRSRHATDRRRGRGGTPLTSTRETPPLPALRQRADRAACRRRPSAQPGRHVRRISWALARGPACKGPVGSRGCSLAGLRSSWLALAGLRQGCATAVDVRAIVSPPRPLDAPVAAFELVAIGNTKAAASQLLGVVRREREAYNPACVLLRTRWMGHRDGVLQA